MTKYFVEVRPAVRRSGAPHLVPLEEVYRWTGFRSVFAYDEATAQTIIELGSTAHLRGVPVYADTLFVDFDKSDGSTLIAALTEQGIGFERWHSGGRSIHLHVPLVPVYGEWVARACKKFVKQHCNDADLTFYHNAGMYRLARTFHPKYPGRMKVLLETRPGRLLEITQPLVNNRPMGPMIIEGASREDFMIALTERKDEGGRRPHIWRLAVMGLEAGIEYYEILEHLQWWNLHFCSPMHADQTLINQLDQACIYVSRKLQA